jgi:hypothetical protein
MIRVLFTRVFGPPPDSVPPMDGCAFSQDDIDRAPPVEVEDLEDDE